MNQLTNASAEIPNPLVEIKNLISETFVCSSVCGECVFAGGFAVLANGLQRGRFGAGVLRDTVAHAGHPVAGGAETVALSAGVGSRVSTAETFQSRPDLGLASHNDKDEDSLECIDHVSDIPEVLRPADCPGNDVHHPSYSHHDDQLHADTTEGSPEITKQAG